MRAGPVVISSRTQNAIRFYSLIKSHGRTGSTKRGNLERDAKNQSAFTAAWIVTDARGQPRFKIEVARTVKAPLKVVLRHCNQIVHKLEPVSKGEDNRVPLRSFQNAGRACQVNNLAGT
jgi:hypothetical protein